MDIWRMVCYNKKMFIIYGAADEKLWSYAHAEWERDDNSIK